MKRRQIVFSLSSFPKVFLYVQIQISYNPKSYEIRDSQILRDCVAQMCCEVSGS